jgi:DNA repair protein RAD50
MTFYSQVNDIMGSKKTCIRSMRMDVAKGKSKFATLDSTIITENASGVKEQNGRRVEEVNCEMASAMGVSKAILNNVIFCHQEDSAWPMDEGKKLKEKFDAIFGTTEYNKAIDKIIKFRKEYLEKQKTCVQEKRYLEETKNDAERKELDYDLLKEKYVKMEKKIAEFENLLAPIEEQMEALLTKEKDYGQLHGKKGGFEAT